MHNENTSGLKRKMKFGIFIEAKVEVKVVTNQEDTVQFDK
jgi:hypothetical protein